MIKLDTLYYDGQCPLCAKEIRYLQAMQKGTLVCVDIHQLKENSTVVTPEAMLQRLHLLTAEQHWLTGLDATVRAWSHTRFGGILAILRWPLIKQVADRFYDHWAKARWRKRYLCQTCKK